MQICVSINETSASASLTLKPVSPLPLLDAVPAGTRRKDSLAWLAAIAGLKKKRPRL
jgi:hypothetical protein